jgi:hypothetical protein
MKNCLYFYELTSDECYRNQAGHILDGALNAVAEDGGVGIPHDTGFHTNFYLLSGLLLWARILGPERIRDDVPRIMDYEITPRARDDEATVSRGASYEGLAFAYLQTGDRRYLYPGIKDLCGLCFTIVYQTYAPTRRFPSGNTVYYRPETGPVAPDSYTSIHGLGRLLTMIPPFLQALHDAGISEEELPVDGGICGHRGPFVRLVPPGAGLATPAWDAPAADYPGGGGEAFTVAPRWSRTRFATLDLSSLWNRKPLAADPFGYDAGAAAFPQMLEAVEQAAMGAVQDNLSGLPWGAEIITGGVPFHLARCAGPDDGGLLVLEEGKTHVIPVGFAAQRLHFFGQAATHGDMQMGVVGAVYRIRYGDGHVEELPLRNLIHYEDWRYLHYAREAPLACAWNPRAFSLVRANAEGLAASELEYIQRQLLQGDGEPRHVETPFGTHPMIEVATGRHAGEYYWFANRVTKLRHLNQFAVDTGGRDVAEIEIADAAEGHEVMLLAITAERPGEDEARGSAAQLSFSDGRASRQALSGNLPLELSAWKREPEAVWSGRSEGAVFSDSTALRLEAVPGRCHVQLTLTGGPVILRVRANGHPVVEEYHLLGSWIRDWPDPIQRLGFEVAAPEGEIEVELEADPGLLYERSWNHIGGNGWVWDAARRRWQRRVPEPWRLLAVEVELLA